jgi:bifunctional enzyme CysN/CysC
VSDAERQQVRVVAAGHVDHGKSTLIGRLLYDTGNLPDGKLAELRALSEKRGVAFEWSFVLDALQSERDQAVTIDTTRIWMRTPERDVVLIDAPGHKEFLRNMVTGASDADAALLLVDADEGVGEQTRRHALLLDLIGVHRVVVAINKMDRVGYALERYRALRAELEGVLAGFGIAATDYVPTCAHAGLNVATGAPEQMPWYGGRTVLAALLALPAIARERSESLRIAVQGVLRRDLTRIVVGRIESGALSAGQEIMLSPARRLARVATLEGWPTEVTAAHGGDSVAFTLEGPVFVDRGDVVSDPLQPPAQANAFRARLLWLGERPLERGDRYRIRLGTRTAQVEVTAFERVVDIDSLHPSDARHARTNDVADVRLASRELLPLDTVSAHPSLGRFILLDGLDIVAGGTVLEALGRADADLVQVDHLLDAGARAARNGHRGAVLWLTGLPAAGKSTIAMRAERALFDRGCAVYVLDGDNVRAGLCSDLGFSPQDRHENIRRVGEVAALFADAGTIAIAAFISPYREDRDAARRAAGAAFHEIYVKADPAACEARDPKGHYRKARSGQLPEFTGITGEYEAPIAPELAIDTSGLSIEAAVDALVQYVEERILAPQRSDLANADFRI